LKDKKNYEETRIVEKTTMFEIYNKKKSKAEDKRENFFVMIKKRKNLDEDTQKILKMRY
jgi:hypothetical protein